MPLGLCQAHSREQIALPPPEQIWVLSDLGGRQQLLELAHHPDAWPDVGACPIEYLVQRVDVQAVCVVSQVVNELPHVTHACASEAPCGAALAAVIVPYACGLDTRVFVVADLEEHRFDTRLAAFDHFYGRLQQLAFNRVDVDLEQRDILIQQDLPQLDGRHIPFADCPEVSATDAARLICTSKTEGLWCLDILCRQHGRVVYLHKLAEISRRFVAQHASTKAGRLHGEEADVAADINVKRRRGTLAGPREEGVEHLRRLLLGLSAWQARKYGGAGQSGVTVVQGAAPATAAKRKNDMEGGGLTVVQGAAPATAAKRKNDMEGGWGAADNRPAAGW
eukprot:scaffold2214_cov128-Isochrysis_galbana.AAC.9